MRPADFTAALASDSYALALEKQFMEAILVPPDTSDQYLARERKLGRQQAPDGARADHANLFLLGRRT